MRVIDGWLIEISTFSSLTQEQFDNIKDELRILAVSTRGLFDDPVLFEGQIVRAYYMRDYHANETADHIRAYLKLIGQDGPVNVVLQAAQWTLRN